MRKTLALTGACLLAAACGSSERSFTYGSPQPATPEELAAALAGQAAISDALAFQATADPATAVLRGPSIAGLPDAMTEALFDGSGLPVAPAAFGAGAWTADPCVKAEAGKITYAGCSRAVNGVEVTLDGTISKGAGAVEWSLVVGLHGTIAGGSGPVTLTGSARLGGGIAVTPTDVDGTSSAVVSVTASGSGLDLTAVVETTATVDVAYREDPGFCITGGTVALEREWTTRPPGMPSTPPYDDRGYLFTWSGCGAVQVAHSP